MVTILDLVLFPGILLLVCGVTYLAVPPLIRWAPALKLLDMPGGRRIHSRPVPRCGGIAVFAGVHAGCAVFYLVPGFPEYSGMFASVWWLRILVLSAAVLALGIVDDRFGVSATVKLAGQVCVAVATFLCGIRADALLGFELPFLVDGVVTVVWLVAVINAFNLVDGMDGVAGGLGAIAALAIAGQALLQGRTGDAVVPLALAVACATFLRYNFHPAQVFLGDGGSMFIGFMVGVLGLSLSAKSTTVVALAIPLLAVGVPFFDTFLAVWRRAAQAALGRQKGGGLWRADSDHLHHRLLRRGLNQRQVALFMYALASLLVILGFGSVFFRSRAVALYLTAFVAAVYVVVRHLAFVEMWYSAEAFARGVHRLPRKNTAVAFYVAADAGILALALTVGLIVLEAPLSVGEWKDRFVALAPAWIGLPFVALTLAKTYQQVWSRARVIEFFYIVGALLAGALLAGAAQRVQGVAGPSSARAFFFVFSGFAVPLLCGVRAFPRLVMDCASTVRSEHESLQGMASRRTLIYGAGQSCTLYLRARTLQSLEKDSEHRHFIGVVDDDTNLHGRYVHGLKVLGPPQMLPNLVAENGVQDIVLTRPAGDDLRQILAQVRARRSDLRVMQWRMEIDDWADTDPPGE